MRLPCVVVPSTPGQPYGRVRLNGRQVYAHRRAWELRHGPIPPGLCILHRCDNPPCVMTLPLRPDGSHDPDEHLFLGSKAENSADMTAKGRQEHGSRHHAAKLTEGDVRAIRRLIRTGSRQVDIARAFGVSPQTICDIKKGRVWR